MTDAIACYFTEDHRRCDRLLAACESTIAAASWDRADEATAAYCDALVRHFAMEEEVLFPELEQVNPGAAGPTGVMRMEHHQMRQLLDGLTASVSARDADTCFGDLETLHMISQQHNTKEEGILYPLADRSLQGGSVSLIERLDAI
jgi:iron-sulfur cluster repair protein YtfE (RIC family)